MPVSEVLKAPFIPGQYYHVVFKSIDGILLFRDENDYAVFLERLAQFTGFVFDTWAYCQLSNHAHFIIKINSLESVLKSIAVTDKTKQTSAMTKLLLHSNDSGVFDTMLERQMNSFMVSYANFCKNKYHHHGGLFQRPFKRIQIDTDAYLQMAIIYVHANTVKHKTFNNYKTYGHSSYGAIIKSNRFYCATTAVLGFFGGLDKFVLLHEEQINYYYQKGFPNSKLE